MNRSVTPMYTASDARREAERQTAAIAANHDTAVVAAAELMRQMRVGVYQHIASHRHGVVREEVLQAFPAGELVDVLLAALVQDGAVVERGGVFSIPQVAA